MELLHIPTLLTAKNMKQQFETIQPWQVTIHNFKQHTSKVCLAWTAKSFTGGTNANNTDAETQAIPIPEKGKYNRRKQAR